MWWAKRLSEKLVFYNAESGGDSSTLSILQSNLNNSLPQRMRKLATLKLYIQKQTRVKDTGFENTLTEVDKHTSFHVCEKDS